MKVQLLNLVIENKPVFMVEFVMRTIMEIWLLYCHDGVFNLGACSVLLSLLAVMLDDRIS